MSSFALSEAGVGPFGYVLVFLVALAGALLVHWLRRKPTGALPPEPIQREAPAPGPVQWRHADNPLLDIPALEDVFRAAAAKAGIDPDTLPRFAPPDGSDGAFVFRDKFDYIYAYYEHGGPTVQHASAVADELAYRVLADRTWMKAYLATVGQPESGRTEQVIREQEAMLAAVDPAWAQQAAHERAVKGTA